MSAITESSSVPAAPTANVLPETTTSQPVAGGSTFIQAPTLADVTAETENQSSFLAALQLAIKNSASWAAFQAAMSALPQNP
jgi:hypothetical protein